MDRLKELLPEMNLEMALMYCADDEDILMEIIEEYVSSNRLEEFESYYAAKDWENYRIAVHALKSTSLTIGLEKLSEEAKALEMACKEGNADFILANHESTMNHFRAVLEALEKVID